MKRLIDGAALARKLRTRKANAVGHTEVMNAYETAMNDAIDAQEITLNTLRDEVYEDAVAHGLWEDYHIGLSEDLLNECHSMIEGEADELYDTIEDWANGHGIERFTEELTDVIIMCFSVAGKLGIDIDAAVRRKIEINKTRPWKHGKE